MKKSILTALTLTLMTISAQANAIDWECDNISYHSDDIDVDTSCARKSVRVYTDDRKSIRIYNTFDEVEYRRAQKRNLEDFKDQYEDIYEEYQEKRAEKGSNWRALDKRMGEINEYAEEYIEDYEENL